MYAILFTMVFLNGSVALEPIPAPKSGATALSKCHTHADMLADRLIAAFPTMLEVKWSCIKTT